MSNGPHPPTQFAEILGLLNRHGVEYVVVGAVAANLAGVPLSTFDLDLVFLQTEENRRHLLAALQDLQAVYDDPAGRQIEPSEYRLEHNRLNLFNTRLGRLDLLPSVAPGWDYAALLTRAVSISFSGSELRVLTLEALIEAKVAAGRPKDLAMLPYLREALALSKQKQESP